MCPTSSVPSDFFVTFFYLSYVYTAVFAFSFLLCYTRLFLCLHSPKSINVPMHATMWLSWLSWSSSSSQICNLLRPLPLPHLPACQPASQSPIHYGQLLTLLPHLRALRIVYNVLTFDNETFSSSVTIITKQSHLYRVVYVRK